MRLCFFGALFVLVTVPVITPAAVSMSDVARETYGTGETGAFFFVGKEHIYADDLMRTKLGIPEHPDRQTKDGGAELDGLASSQKKRISNGFTFSAMSEKSKQNLDSHTKHSRIVLEDSPQ